MADSEQRETTASGDEQVPPTIHEASCASNGDVVKGKAIAENDAVTRRKQGLDVVTCGDNLSANRDLARRIEAAANGAWQQHRFHRNAGPNALPHVQPKTRPPEGHTFYETPNRKAR